MAGVYSMERAWEVVNYFHPSGVIIYRKATIDVNITVGTDLLQCQVKFQEYDNFVDDSVNVRVLGGPLLLDSFNVLPRKQYSDILHCMHLPSDKKVYKGKVLSSAPLHTGLLHVTLQQKNGQVLQLTDVKQISTKPRREATIQFQFQRNPKLTSLVAKVPMQINYQLAEVKSHIAYQLNLNSMKLEGFLCIKNNSNKIFAGQFAYSGKSLDGQRPSRPYARSKSMRMSAESTMAAPTTGEMMGLDNTDRVLDGVHVVPDYSNAKLLFLSNVVMPTLYFEADIPLPAEVRDLHAHPFLRFPLKPLPQEKLPDGELTLYDSDNFILSQGELAMEMMHTKTGLQASALVTLRPLNHSVTIKNTPSFKAIANDLVEVTNNLEIYHGGQTTTELRIKFPEQMYWGHVNYVAHFGSNLEWKMALQPGTTTETMKPQTYQAEKTIH